MVGAVREVEVKGVRWLVREDVAEALLQAGALDVWELAGASSAKLVKKGPHRTVFRVSLPRGGDDTLDLYVKSFRLPRLRDLVRYMLRPSRGKREWRVARFLEDAGIPTVPCVAVGERRVARVLREDCFMTEAVPDVVPLDRFLLEDLARMDGVERGRLIRRAAPVLARFVRRLHDAGVFHRDFHAGNLLLRRGNGGTRELMLVDLHNVRCGGPLSLGARLHNLTQLNRFFSMRVPRTVRLRFWREYVRDIGLLEDNWRTYARLLEERTALSCGAFWRRRGRSCLRTNRRFRKFRMRGGMRGHTRRGRMEVPEKALRGIPERGRMMPDAVVLKDSQSTRVWEQRLDFGSEVRTIIVKRKVRLGVWKRLRSVFRRVGALGEWRMAYAMTLRELPVARALAAFERRNLGMTQETWLITEKVESLGNLHVFAERTFGGVLSPEKARLRRRLARRLGRVIRRMHGFGFSQRDLKASNILVSDDGQGDYHFTLVDLEGMRHRTKTSGRLRARDLGRLVADFVDSPAVRTTDMMHFLDEYLAGSGCSRAHRRVFINEVRRAVQEKLAAWKSKES